MMSGRLSLQQIKDAFPDECKNVLPQEIKNIKRALKPYRDHIKWIENTNHDLETENFLVGAVRVLYQPYKQESLLKFNESLLRLLKNKQNPNILSDDQINMARNTPIASLYEFKGVRAAYNTFIAICPFHEQKTGSFKVYPTNTFYCFSCCQGGDSIEFVKKIYTLNFKEAVKYIISERQRI